MTQCSRISLLCVCFTLFLFFRIILFLALFYVYEVHLSTPLQMPLITWFVWEPKDNYHQPVLPLYHVDPRESNLGPQACHGVFMHLGISPALSQLFLSPWLHSDISQRPLRLHLEMCSIVSLPALLGVKKNVATSWSLLSRFIYFDFYVYECFLCIYICVLYVCLVLGGGGRKSHGSPKNWKYRRLWAAMWMLATSLGSSEE